MSKRNSNQRSRTPGGRRLLGIFTIVLSALGASAAEAAPPRSGEAKALLAKHSLLLALPNASAAAPIDLFAGLDATVVEDYENSTLLAIRDSQVETLQTRSNAARIQLNVREDFDHVFINGRRIDTRLGTAAPVVAVTSEGVLTQ